MTENELICNFCGKTESEVDFMIKGPGVYICDKCVKVCQEIIDDKMIERAIEDTEEMKFKELWGTDV
jgi:ATP-dependent Clp protease ATP-binding subunit ClpX